MVRSTRVATALAPRAPIDEVSLPVAGDGPVAGLGRALGDIDHPHYLRPFGTRPRGRRAEPPRTQAGGQLLAQLAFGLDVDGLVDGFVRHPPLWLAGVVPA